MKNGVCQLFLKFAYWVTEFWSRWPDLFDDTENSIPFFLLTSAEIQRAIFQTIGKDPWSIFTSLMSNGLILNTFSNHAHPPILEASSPFYWHGLTHWGRATHICVCKLTIIASDNGLSPGRRQAIIWNNAGILSIGLLGTNFSAILIEILTYSFTKMRLKVSSAKWRSFSLGLDMLT